ncbi:MAG: class I SAM-dependent methyltransferase [Burkholderiales bacterium]
MTGQSIEVIEPALTHYGGSADAIRYHYDVGRAFYQLWLDEGMTYSCALWREDDPAQDNLHAAQLRKVQFHLELARANRATRLLDIGCGWGELLRAAAALPRLQAIVGLTLSEDQAAYVKELKLPKVEVRLESWVDHRPVDRYDAITSIGAFEHFAKPDDSVERKIAVYRDFFQRCRDWLAPSGRMSLQTIAYGSMKREDASAFINDEIFPAADLPRLDDIARAADGIMEITTVHNHRLHYARTFEQWVRNLRQHRVQAVRLVGEAVTARYERYLTQSCVGFYMGKIGLLRIGLRPVSNRWADNSQP